jgi:hypothetical protein
VVSATCEGRATVANTTDSFVTSSGTPSLAVDIGKRIRRVRHRYQAIRRPQKNGSATCTPEAGIMRRQWFVSKKALQKARHGGRGNLQTTIVAVDRWVRMHGRESFIR